MLDFKDEKPRALLLGVKLIERDNPPKNLIIFKLISLDYEI